MELTMKGGDDLRDAGGVHRVHARDVTVRHPILPFVAKREPTVSPSAIVVPNQWPEMMLKGDTVYLQLTDDGMKQVAERQDAHDKDEGFLDSVLKAMALSGVKQFLDHSLALSLVGTRSAQVRDGEVVFVTCRGKLPVRPGAACVRRRRA